MTRPLAALAALLLTAGGLGAQGRVDVTGTVTDSTGAGLQGATVVLLQPADSTIASFAMTAADGAFRVRRVPAGPYLLRASFVGYASATREVTVGAEPLDVGRIALAEATGAVGRLVVEAERVPMVVRQDTLEYNADAFRTPMGATVEDLLKRLPGVEVEADGSIKAQGEAVRKVLVDGKEFFGDDPTVATRNLPADAVDRVQVYDKQSDTAEFTGVEDGAEARTINLALKEDRKRGAFGNVGGGLGGAGGAGPGMLYDGQASVNRFSPSTQLSLIANVNNVNRQSFSVGDYFNFMGGAARRGGGRGGVFRLGGDGIPVGDGLSDGFATTWSGGLNLNREFGAGTSVRASYFLGRLGHEQTRRVVQDRFFGEGLSSREEQDGDQDRETLSHRLNLAAEHEIGEGHDVRVRSDLRLADAALASASRRQTFGAEGLENGSTSAYGSDGRDWGGDAAVTYRRRFAGNRSVVANVGAGLQDNRLDGDLAATNRFYEAGDLLTTQELARLQDQDGRSWTRSAEVLLTQPLGTDRALQLSVEHGVTTEDQARRVFDRRPGGPVPNDSLSLGFERSLQTSRAGLTYRYNREPWGLSVGLGLQRSRLGGAVQGAAGAVGRQFLDLLPSATLSYAISQGRNLELGYRAETREPSLRELQPVADTQDPLAVYVGNPDLRPEATHSLNARYLSFDAFTSTNLFAFVRASYTARTIATSRTVDARFRQTSTPVNAGGTWTVLANGSFGTPVRPLRARVNVSANALYNRGLELVNGAENASDLWRTTLDLRVENRDKERLDLQAGARLAFNDASYALSPQRDRSYVNRAFYGELGWTPTDAWDVRTRLDVSFYPDDVFAARSPSGVGGGRSVPLWEATASRSFMGGRARVELVARDLLDRNLGVSFASTASYVQEERVDSLGRHVLLRLVYNLAGGPRPGGVRFM